METTRFLQRGAAYPANEEMAPVPTKRVRPYRIDRIEVLFRKRGVLQLRRTKRIIGGPTILMIRTIMAFSHLVFTGCSPQCGTVPPAGNIPAEHAVIGDWLITRVWGTGVVNHAQIEFLADGTWDMRAIDVYGDTIGAVAGPTSLTARSRPRFCGLPVQREGVRRGTIHLRRVLIFANAHFAPYFTSRCAV